MATLTKTVYVYAYFTKEGKFSSFTINTFPLSSGMSEHGMWVLLYEHVLNLDVPEDMADVNAKAAQELNAFMLAERGKHQVRMMQLEAVRNSLLGLEYSEVLGKVEASPKQASDDFDDVPF